jgi:hypothetical protein
MTIKGGALFLAERPNELDLGRRLDEAFDFTHARSKMQLGVNSCLVQRLADKLPEPKETSSDPRTPAESHYIFGNRRFATVIDLNVRTALQ